MVATSLLAIAGYAAVLPVPAGAQVVEVNGQNCPGAVVVQTGSGMLTVIPPACGGNGNICDSALATFSLNKISIQASPSCLAAGLIPSPVVLGTVLVNGAICNAATVTFSAGRMEIEAPPACLSGSTPVPAIINFSPPAAYAGQTVVISGLNFAADATVLVGGVAATVVTVSGTGSLTIVIPAVPTGPQLVAVTVGGQASSAVPIDIVPVPIPVTLQSVVSRKVHGTAGTFNLPIDYTQPLGGPVSVEPRRPGAGHTIVFQFDQPVTSLATVTAVDSSFFPVSVSAQISGNEVAVTWPNATDNRRIRISLAGLNGVSSAAASIGFLAGDVNGSRAIDGNDLRAVKAFSGLAADNLSFRHDLKASGIVNAADIATVKARQGISLGP